MTSSLSLPFDDDSLEARLAIRDREARLRAVDPAFNVALQASAGTGKTRVLVDRYLNLLRAGVDPANVLAITFTRKAAAEMRGRIVSVLREAGERGELAPARWRELKDRLGEIAISTIDAFCLSLLREFPLEADVDPGFRMADDMEVPRLVDESLDRTMRTCRAVSADDPHVALVFAQLGERRVRRGLAALLNRRVVAPDLLERYLETGPRHLTIAALEQHTRDALRALFASMPGDRAAFLDSGPLTPGFALVRASLDALDGDEEAGAAGMMAVILARLKEHFLTHEGEPRRQLTQRKADFATESEFRRHRSLVVDHAPAFAAALRRHRHGLNVLVSRGVRRMFQVAEREYAASLEAHAVLDFSEALLRARVLLRHMDEFARSRFRLESRYHHILLDEFQDTSRAQWDLVSLLVRSWGEGAGLAHLGPLPPSIFIVGDPKQSIYGFRDADASILSEAGSFLDRLRPEGDTRRSISRNFRGVSPLLAFVNDVCAEIAASSTRRDGFRYTEDDRFPTSADLVAASPERTEALGLCAAETSDACAARIAAEVARVLQDGVVRDRETGVARPARASDVAILFRSRDSHREVEEALEVRGIRAYVYKGLGFFDSDEIKDVLTLLAFLAEPSSDLRAAAWLRSRFVGLSDVGLTQLAPGIADALTTREPIEIDGLDEGDAALLRLAQPHVHRWLALVDRVPPAELLDLVLAESAYGVELRGPRLAQARENLKKLRALLRRIQNRGYATLRRVAEHIDRLSLGDESNAAIDAGDAVSLMTIHASKGLEFPIVFVVNLCRGTAAWRDPIRIEQNGSDAEPVAVSVGDFLSEADADRTSREREETKRLLYVALTRARDRLYLATVLKDGVAQPGRGSLADVLPPAFLPVFAQAHTAHGGATWQSPNGGVHRFAIVGPAEEVSSAPGRVLTMAEAPHRDEDFARLVSAPAALPIVGPASADADPTSDNGARLVGSLVHRLLRRIGVRADCDLDTVRRLVPLMLRADDEVDGPLPDALVTQIERAYRAVVTNADLVRLLKSGVPHYEVPFSLREDNQVRRGAIDCLVRSEDRVTVLEFKTGRPHPEHDAQLAAYRRAVSRLFPDVPVDGRVVYV